MHAQYEYRFIMKCVTDADCEYKRRPWTSNWSQSPPQQCPNGHYGPISEGTADRRTIK